MVEDDQFSAVLSEFARTLVTDFPIQGILDHLVNRIVDVLPITSSGVTLITPGTNPRYLAASNEAALRFERLQTELGEGPCLAAYRSGEAVSVPDLRVDDRFPAFSPAASAGGLAAVFTFPLRHGDGRLGALDLYCDDPGPLDPHNLEVAQTLADVVAAYLLNAQARQEAREISDRFRTSSLHDALTGLPNRVLLQERIDHAAMRARRSHTEAAVLFADLDNFKRVNDLYGHPVGDQLLVAVAKRISALVRPGDTLARVSGDEFVILCEDLTAPGDAELLATRIGEAFTAPFLLTGNDQALLEVSVTASIGMAFAGRAEDISDRLVRDADVAMYQAKRQGGATHRLIDIRAAAQAHVRGEMERDLRAAFTRDNLEVAYQPIVRSADGLVTGVETLLRWKHPEHGPIPTLDMVAVAEQSSLIVEIGAWVLERGCEDHRRWSSGDGGAALDMAVNVSARQLMGAGFCASVAAVLHRTGMDPAALVLEMTEGILIEDSPRAVTVLADLKGLGVRLALDDFGTGYSSLSYLRTFPVDIIKIDQGFVADLQHDVSAGAIIASITNLAHALGLSVTAEGVETREQRDQIAAIGCESAQGFHYSRPLPAREFAALLRDSPDARPRLPLESLPAQTRRSPTAEGSPAAGRQTRW